MVQFWKSSVCRIKIICLYMSWHQASRYPSIGPSRISRYLDHFIQQWTAQFRMVIQLRATEELLCQLLNDKIIVFVDFYMIFLAQAKWCHFTHSKLLSSYHTHAYCSADLRLTASFLELSHDQNLSSGYWIWIWNDARENY